MSGRAARAPGAKEGARARAGRGPKARAFDAPGARDLALRAPDARDEVAFVAAARRSGALHRPFVHAPSTPDAFRAWLLRAREPGRACHVLVDRRTRALVGVVNLNEIAHGALQSACLGYYAFAPFEGRGLLRAGVALAVARAFGALGLHRVEANIQPANARSIALVRALGFRCEGLSPRYLKVGGRWRDHERWALLREEWRAARPRRA